MASLSGRYVELHAASAFSFLQGASLPETLAERAANLGYSALAQLDRDGIYGAPRFHRAARHVGLRPIIGAELTMRHRATGARLQAPARTPGSRARREQPLEMPDAPPWILPVLVEAQEGYRQLCRLITRMKLRSPKGEGSLGLE